jgi:general secretion pathway protein G
MEILIVVVILGILAAVVVPHLTSATTDSRQKAIESQLQTLRRQIELYRLEHAEALPDLSTGWTAMTATHDFNGKPLGPYVATEPQNVLNGLSNVTVGDGTSPAATACGYVYDFTGTGQIFATDADGKTIYLPN